MNQRFKQILVKLACTFGFHRFHKIEGEYPDNYKFDKEDQYYTMYKYECGECGYVYYERM